MNILVGGDSWPWGCILQPGGEFVQGKQFSAILETKGYAVDNVSRPGYSNIQSSKDIIFNLHRGYDHIVWVQTDPIRDFLTIVLTGETQWVDTHTGQKPKYEMEEVYQGVLEDGNLYNFMQRTADKIYAMLDKAAKEHHVLITCLGGCSKLFPVINKYNNLIPLMYSIPEFLIPGHIDNPYYNTNAWLDTQYADICKREHNNLIIEDWLLVTRQTIDKMFNWKTEAAVFYPDEHHPNAHGHELIAARLDDYFQSKTNK